MTNIGHPTWALRDIASVQSWQHDFQKVTPEISEDIRFSAYCRHLSGGTVNFIVHWMRHPEVTEEEAFEMLCSIHSAPSRIAIDYLMEHAQGM